MHDFLIKELGRAVPYGVYDLAANAGWVSVGIDHDTAAFAVADDPPLVARGRAARAIPGATRLLDHRRRRRQQRLARAAVEARAAAPGRRDRPDDQRAHFPPGTSKWNKIEHRLFSFITQNWRGQAAGQLRGHRRPDRATTTTRTGLTVHCELDANSYPKGHHRPDEASGTIPSGHATNQVKQLMPDRSLE